MKVKIPNDIIAQCENFANRVIATNKERYRIRKQSDTAFIKQQIVQGKIAEFAVWILFGKLPTTPDLEVYSANNKSFEGDLKLRDITIHVKSQSKYSAMTYGQSWVFQYEDPLFKKSKNTDMCAFCIIEEDEVELVMFKPFNSLVFGEPKLKKFTGIKKMVYFSDNI